MLTRFNKTLKVLTVFMPSLFFASCMGPEEILMFDGESARNFAVQQVEFGPRIPGTQSHAETAGWISESLEGYGWQVEIQEAENMGHPIKNIIAKRGQGSPWIIVGAHYDSRMFADQEESPENATKPVPGANDGASGVAVLLELARVFPEEFDGQLWLVFFDAEDNGNIEGWDWILGSQTFVGSLEGKPDVAVIVDMVGDADLNIHLEHNSDFSLSLEIWSVAERLGFGSVFIPEKKYQMLDDHLPFIGAGIPSVLIIDFDYPFWHTLEDTPDKISGSSLAAVGETLQHWLFGRFSITVP